jgi:hypothetical protein
MPSQRPQYGGTVHLCIGTGHSPYKITSMPFTFGSNSIVIHRGLNGLFIFKSVSFSATTPKLSCSHLRRRINLRIIWASPTVILTRVRRYLFTHYTPETLLNLVFEDLRKPKASNNSRNEQDTGTQGAITNGTPVPSPWVRTTPPHWRACGATRLQVTHRRPLQQQRQRPSLRVAKLQQRWPQGRRRCNNALAHIYARGARISTKSRRPGARMVAVIPSATRTSPAAATSVPTTGAVCPPADPHSDPPGRAEHRPPRRGTVPGQRQDSPRTRTLP